jgi:folylpolyglutamate synthase/dihydrofolate synthase
MNYSEALTFIHSINSMFCNPGLERTKALCEALGNPQDSLKFIHIAGTNGKGSTSSMLSSILMEAGYTVGLYTSPFILRFNERIRVNGVEISDDDLANITSIVRPIAEKMTDKPTEFELITAIAFYYFKMMGCDFVVLECGLGGRYDATNVVNTAALSLITGISLDHTAILGDTIEKIAWEKAGIIKGDVPVIFGGNNEAAFTSCADHTSLLPSPLFSKETLESEMRAYEVRKNNELIFDSTRAEKSASLKEMLEEAICKASALTSLRIGDFVAVELAPAGVLAAKDEGSAAFRASYCENDMYDFKLIF